MPSYQEFDSLEEAQKALEQQNSLPYGHKVANDLFPNVQITSDVRSPDSTLGREHPSSYHVQTDKAIDMRAYPGMTFDQAKKKFTDAGYDLIEARDEYTNPSKWATGGHWHFVIGDNRQQGVQQFDSLEEAQKALQSQTQTQPQAEVPVESPQEPSQVVSAPILPHPASVQHELTGGEPTPAGQTAVTGAEEAQQKDIESILYNSKGKKWDTVASEIQKKYPDQFAQTADKLRWYYDYYQKGGKAGVQWTADPNRPAESTSPDITVTARPDLETMFSRGLQAEIDAYHAAGQQGFPGLAARKIIQALNPNLSEEQIVQAQRDLLDEYNARVANEAPGVAGAIGTFPASMLGGAGPELLLPGAVGETTAARLMSGAAINEAADLGYQAEAVHSGVQEDYSPESLLLSAAGGAGFQGVIEGLTRLAREHGTTVRSDEAGKPYVELPTKEGFQRVYNPEQPISTKGQLLAGTARPVVEPRPSVQAPTPDFRSKPEIERQIAVTSAGWKSPPEFTVHQSFSDLPEHEQLAIQADTDGHPEEVKAWVDQNGKVNVIGDHLDDPSDVTALTYHEALGHVGLGKQFGTLLEGVLERAYKTNPKLKDEVDQWFREGGVVPESAASPTARATEEVLAEKSESGPLDASTWERLKAVVKDFARRAGLKNLSYSDGEIRAILAMAHDQVIKGGKTFVGQSGNRYVRVTHVSPHEFTNTSEEHPYGEFDHSKMGTGEGAQVYGWGTYLGEKTHQFYHDKFKEQLFDPRQDLTINGTPFGDFASSIFHGDPSMQDWEIRSLTAKVADDLNTYRERLSQSINNFHTVLNSLIQDAEDTARHYREQTSHMANTHGRFSPEVDSMRSNARYYDNEVDLLKAVQKEGSVEVTLAKKPHTYEVEIHPHQTEKMLHWDKPLNEQPPLVKKGLAKLGFKAVSREEIAALRKAWNDASERVFNFHEKQVWPLKEAITEERMRVYDQAYRENIRKGMDELVAEEAADKVEAAVVAKLHEDQKFKDLEAELARLKTEEKKAEEKYVASKPLKGEQIYKTLKYRFNGDQEAASRALLKEGIIGNKYEDGFSQTRTGEKTYNYVIFDEKQAKIINKYMRKKKDVTPTTEEAAPKVDRFVNSINLDNLDTSGNIDAVIRQAGKDIPKTKVSFDEIRAFADENAMSFKEVRDYAETNGGARLLAMRRVLLKSAQKTMKIARSIDAGDNSTINLALFARSMATHRAIQESLTKAISDAARTLNALKIRAEAGTSELETLRYMAKKSGAEILGSEKGIEELAKQLVHFEDNPTAQNKMMKDAYEPWPEDYLLSFRYNMMLYSLSTQMKNFLGNFANMYTDLFEHGIAAGLGNLRGRPQDRISAREVVSRQLGMIEALTSAGTYKDLATSFSEGKPTHQVSKVEVGHNVFARKFGAAGAAVDLPMKALAATDSYFRSIIEMGEFYGMAHRKALSEGLSGEAYQSRVAELIANPTDEMKAMADTRAATLQFVDDPSSLGIQLEKWKARPANKQDYGKRALRVAVHLIAPFTRVSDRIFWTAVRRVPIVGFLDRINRADWQAGGARRDLVISRMIMGASIIGFFVAKAQAGELSGQGPSNFDQKAQMQAEGWQPNSVKVGDQWVSMAGFDQAQVLASAAATFAETYKDKDFQDQDGLTQAISLMGAAANSVANNTFLQQIGEFFAMFGNSSLAKNAQENYLANQAATFVPSGVRQAAEMADGNVRDTSGTGSAGDKIINKVESFAPNLRGDFPVRNDVYGRPVKSVKNILGIAQSSQVDQDPVIKEVSRLTKVNEDRPLVTPVDRGDLKKALGLKKVDASIVQEYQRVSGQYILESLREHMNDPSWHQLNDAERIKLVRKISSQMRKYAREDLFEEVK